MGEREAKEEKKLERSKAKESHQKIIKLSIVLLGGYCLIQSKLYPPTDCANFFFYKENQLYRKPENSNKKIKSSNRKNNSINKKNKSSKVF